MDDQKSKKIIRVGNSEITEHSNALAERGLDLVEALRKRTIRVPQDYPTIEEAIAEAKDGDKIEISEGTYFVSASIEKSLEIFGTKDTDVVLKPASEDKPTLYFPKLETAISLRNLNFVGKPTKDFGPAILADNIKLEISNCSFTWYELWSRPENKSIGDPKIESYGNFKSRIAIKVQSEFHRLMVQNSDFHNCETAIQASRKSIVDIKNCTFKDSTLEILDEARITTKENFFWRGKGIVLGKNSYLQSRYDTFFHLDTLIRSSSPFIAEFFHCTMLVFCLLEKSERTASDNLQNPWSRGTPSMLFSNCIVSSDCCIRLPSIFGPIETNFERNSDEMFPFTEIFQFTKNNLINNPPNFLDADVKLEFTGYELQLLPDSPGRNQAHDGTHLGAWQGDTL